MKYFHELTDKEYLSLRRDGDVFMDALTKFSEPPWCKNKNALNFKDGCYSLLNHSISKKVDCNHCSDIKKECKNV
jgi:hypothetical protein